MVCFVPLLRAPLVALLLVATTVHAQEPLALHAQRELSADDAQVFFARVEQLGALVASGALALTPEELTELKAGLLRTCSTVVISGEVHDAPLSEVLLTIVRAGRERGKAPSLVIRPDDLVALGEVRVTAMFASTPAVDAVRALLRSQEATETLNLEVTEEDDVFVVAVHRWEQDADEADEDGRRKQPPAEERPLVPDEEAPVPGYLGVGSNGAVLPGSGVVIDSVDASSPAAAGGLLPGDVISAIDGLDVKSWEQLRAVIRSRSAGDDLVLDVLRAGQRRRVLVTLGRSP